MKILIVEDDSKIGDLVSKWLSSRGFETKVAPSAKDMDAAMSRQRFDALVLDVMLPGEDGLSIVRRLRATGERLPIVIVSGRGDDMDRILGLEMGADDYLPKPFNPRELEARLNAVLRRAHEAPLPAAPDVESREFLFGKWKFNTGTMTLTSDGVDVPLTSAEFAMLKVFVQHPKIVLSRDRLMDLSDGKDRDAFDRSIDVRVVRLRKLIEDDPANPKIIKTVRGAGYVFFPHEA